MEAEAGGVAMHVVGEEAAAGGDRLIEQGRVAVEVPWRSPAQHMGAQQVEVIPIGGRGTGRPFTLNSE